MSIEFRLPDLGEGVHEGEIVRVLVSEGDQVKEDQPLLEVETDKASVEIPSPHTGVVLKIHVAERQTVNVGEVLVTFADAAGKATVEVKKTPSPQPSPARGGEGDVVERSSRTSTITRPSGGKTKPASPAVRKLARQLGVDLASIEGSAPGGRVTREDVERAASQPPLPLQGERAGVRGRAVQESAGAGHPPDQWGPTHRESLTRARRTIAEAMVRSKSVIPHATDTDDADITDLDHLRREHRSAGKPDRKLTVLPFVIRATALALQEFPIFNASYDQPAGEIVYHDYISIAIGVHTERGLIAPVLRNVDQMNIPQLADALAALAEKTRTASFEVNDTRGGTFTISNAGAIGGSRYSIPIVNHPQAAILALGRSRWQPWVVDGSPAREIVPRLILPLSISFDHRLIDGAQEVRFMQTIIGSLENPKRLMAE